MSLQDREYMNPEKRRLATKKSSKASNAYTHSGSYPHRKSPSEESFGSHPSEFDGGKFSCISCGSSYSTKESAATCFRNHSSDIEAESERTSMLYRVKKYICKIKISITNLVSKR